MVDAADQARGHAHDGEAGYWWRREQFSPHIYGV
jgi:hypothetical protein